MLIDTSVWIEWINGRENKATRLLDSLLDDGDAWLAPIVLQEILQGARNERQLNDLYREFIDQPIVTASLESYALAGTLYARCRWQGITVRSPHDCLIAAQAVEYDHPLLTLDRDFQAIAGIEPRLILVDPS